MQTFELQQIFRWIEKNRLLYVGSSSIANHSNTNLLNDLKLLIKGIQQFIALKLQNHISVRWDNIGIFMVWKNNTLGVNTTQNCSKSFNQNNKQTSSKQKHQALKCKNHHQNKQQIFNKLQSQSSRHKNNLKQQMKKKFKLTFQANPKLNQQIKQKNNILTQSDINSQSQHFKFIFPQTEDMFQFVSNNYFAFYTKNQLNQQHQIGLYDNLQNFISYQKYEYVKQLNRIFIKAVFDLLQLGKKLMLQFKFIKIFMNYGEVKYKYKASWLQGYFYQEKNTKKNLFDDPIFKNRNNMRFQGIEKNYQQTLKQNFLPDEKSQKFIKKSINKYKKIGEILDQKFRKLINDQ